MIRRNNFIFLLLFIFFSIATFSTPSISHGRGYKKVRRYRKSKKKITPKRVIKRKKEFKTPSNERAIPSGADKIGSGEHPPALLGLPVDIFGLVNWVQAVKQTKIDPIDISGPMFGRRDKFYDGVVIYNALNPEWGDVIFDHDLHTFHIDCDSCHPSPFGKTHGKQRIFMILIKNGKLCGKCHGKIAFPIENCDRCHVLPKSNIKW